MFGSMQTGVSAYARVGVETGVVAASPHKLISMLFEGAITALGNAVRHTHAREIAGKGQSISKAIAIIDNGLRASLNKEAGGSIAAGLDELYAYMSRRLIEANLHSDVAVMEEIAGLLRELKQSWEAIAEAAPATTPAPTPTPAAAPAAGPHAASIESTLGAAAYGNAQPRNSTLIKA